MVKSDQIVCVEDAGTQLKPNHHEKAQDIALACSGKPTVSVVCTFELHPRRSVHPELDQIVENVHLFFLPFSCLFTSTEVKPDNANAYACFHT